MQCHVAVPPLQKWSLFTHHPPDPNPLHLVQPISFDQKNVAEVMLYEVQVGGHKRPCSSAFIPLEHSPETYDEVTLTWRRTRSSVGDNQSPPGHRQHHLLVR